MTLSKSQLCRQTFDAALAFDALHLWEEFDDHVCFPLRVPSAPHLAFATIMGSGGEEYGITVFRGPDSGTHLLRLLASEAMDDGDADALEMISFGMTPLHEVPPVGREFLRAAKVSPKRDDLVPLFFAKDPGKHPRALSRDEVGEMLMILRGLSKLSREGRLEPSPVFPGAPLHVYTFGGDPQNPDVSVEEGVFPTPPVETPGLVAFPGDLGGLPRLPGAWVIGFPVLPMRVDEIEGSVRCLMVADVKDGHVLLAEIPRRADAEGAIELLRGTFHGKNARKQKGLPGSAVFTDRELHDAFAPVLSGLGVGCSYEPGHPLLEGLKAGLNDWLASGTSIQSAGRGGRARRADRPRKATMPDAVPPPRRPRMPQIVNFDGDPLEMHTAHFALTDAVAARKALGKRRDIAFEDDDGTAAAWEPAGARHADRMPGGKVAAGRLRFEDGTLIFETNSAERYRRARAWLDTIPGIAFSKLEAQSLDAAIEENRRSPRKPDPPLAPTREALEQVQRMLDEQYMQWLDEKIPALGGKTPRQACATAAGRRQVARMIRTTYPDPGGMPGLRVPREKMLRALGLAAES